MSSVGLHFPEALVPVEAMKLVLLNGLRANVIVGTLFIYLFDSWYFRAKVLFKNSYCLIEV